MGLGFWETTPYVIVANAAWELVSERQAPTRTTSSCLHSGESHRRGSLSRIEPRAGRLQVWRSAIDSGIVGGGDQPYARHESRLYGRGVGGRRAADREARPHRGAFPRRSMFKPEPWAISLHTCLSRSTGNTANPCKPTPPPKGLSLHTISRIPRIRPSSRRRATRTALHSRRSDFSTAGATTYPTMRARFATTTSVRPITGLPGDRYPQVRRARARFRGLSRLARRAAQAPPPRARRRVDSARRGAVHRDAIRRNRELRDYNFAMGASVG